MNAVGLAKQRYAEKHKGAKSSKTSKVMLLLVVTCIGVVVIPKTVDHDVLINKLGADNAQSLIEISDKFK